MRVPTDKVLSDLTFNDMSARHEVELIIRQDSLVLWLNVDGVCRARIITNGFVPIVIKDDRVKDEY